MYVIFQIIGYLRINIFDFLSFSDFSEFGIWTRGRVKGARAEKMHEPRETLIRPAFFKLYWPCITEQKRTKITWLLSCNAEYYFLASTEYGFCEAGFSAVYTPVNGNIIMGTIGAKVQSGGMICFNQLIYILTYFNLFKANFKANNDLFQFYKANDDLFQSYKANNDLFQSYKASNDNLFYCTVIFRK